jgi:hypothetical protein
MTTPGEQGPQRSRGQDTELSKREALRILRRAGFPPETIRSVEEELPDPIDIVRDGDALAAHGITHSTLEDAFGASP